MDVSPWKYCAVICRDGVLLHGTQKRNRQAARQTRLKVQHQDSGQQYAECKGHRLTCCSADGQNCAGGFQGGSCLYRERAWQGLGNELQCCRAGVQAVPLCTWRVVKAGSSCACFLAWASSWVSSQARNSATCRSAGARGRRCNILRLTHACNPH